MPLVDGVKYSCYSCIKGHRSAHCIHDQRPLIEIKKKGRPSSGCVPCKEARKKSIHLKCTHCPPEQRPPPLVLPNGLDPNSLPLPLRLLPQISTLKLETNSSSSKSTNNNNFSSASSTTSSVSSDQGDNLSSLSRKKSLTCKKELPNKLHGLDHGHSSSNSHHHHSHNSQRPYPIIPHALPQQHHQQSQQQQQQQASSSSLAGFEFRPRADSTLSDTPFLSRSNSASSSSNITGAVRFNEFYSPPFSNNSSNSESPGVGVGGITSRNGMEFDFNNELELNSPIISVPLSSTSSTHPSNLLIHHQHQNTIVDWNQLLQQGQPSSTSSNNNNNFSSNQMAYNAQSNPAPPSSSAGYPYGVQNSSSYSSWPVHSQQQQQQQQQQSYQQQQPNQNQYQQQQQVPLTHSSLAHLIYPLPQPSNYLEHPPTPPSSIHFDLDLDLDESEYELEQQHRNEFLYGNNVSHPLDREESLEEFLAALERVEEEGGRRDFTSNYNASVNGEVGSSVAGSEYITKVEEDMNDWELVGTNTGGSVVGEDISYDYSSSIYNPAVQQRPAPRAPSAQSQSQSQSQPQSQPQSQLQSQYEYEQYEQQQKLQLHQQIQQQEQQQQQQHSSEQDWRSVNYNASTNSNSSVAASLDGQDHNDDQDEFEYETSNSNSISLFPNHQQQNSGSRANNDDRAVKIEDYDEDEGDEENNEFMSTTLHNNHPFLGANGPGGGKINEYGSSAVDGGETFDINRWRSDLEVHFDNQLQRPNHPQYQSSNLIQSQYRSSSGLGSADSGGSTGHPQEILWSNPNLNSSNSNFDLLPPPLPSALSTENHSEYSINRNNIKLESTTNTNLNQRVKQEDQQFINGHFNLSLESNSHPPNSITTSSILPGHFVSSRLTTNNSTSTTEWIKEEDWLVREQQDAESRRIAADQRVHYSNSLETHHYQQQHQTQDRFKQEEADMEGDGYGNEDPTTPHFSMISRVKYEDDNEERGTFNLNLDDDDIIKKEEENVESPKEWGT